MKGKAIITAVLLAASNFALANGGLSIDNVQQNMNAENTKTTESERPKIVAKGPIDKFENAPKTASVFVDTDRLQHSYDGIS